MFLRSLIILILAAQPALTLVVSRCGETTPSTAESSCCCCGDMACPAGCPCLVNDDQNQEPGESTPALPPAPEQLLTLLIGTTTAMIDPDVDHPALTTVRNTRFHPTTSRSYRALIGVWQT